jgi:hypothetical protein
MLRRRTFMMALAAGLTIGVVPEGHACGQCKEDKIAATYDYAVVVAAGRNGQTVVFTEIRGAMGPASRIESWVRQQVEGSPGVVHGTARVSLEPAAVSFVCERSTSVSAALSGIRPRLSRRGLSLELIEAQTAPRTKTRS